MTVILILFIDSISVSCLLHSFSHIVLHVFLCCFFVIIIYDNDVATFAVVVILYTLMIHYLYVSSRALILNKTLMNRFQIRVCNFHFIFDFINLFYLRICTIIIFIYLINYQSLFCLFFRSE